MRIFSLNKSLSPAYSESINRSPGWKSILENSEYKALFLDVHRLLLASLGEFRSIATTQNEVTPNVVELFTALENKTDGLYSSEELSSVCNHMNEKHWAAQQVQRSSLELFQALFFKDKPVDDPSRYADGIICQLRGTNGFIAFVPRYGIRGAVCIKDASGHIAWADYATSESGTIRWLKSDQDLVVERVYSSERSDCGFLQIRNSKTKEIQQYHMFDHVYLKININETIAHGLNLRLELVGFPRTINSDNKLKQASTTTENLSTCTPNVNMSLIKNVQEIDAAKRRKRDVNDQEHFDVSKRMLLVAQLHDCSSVYHRFHRFLHQSNEECGN